MKKRQYILDIPPNSPIDFVLRGGGKIIPMVKHKDSHPTLEEVLSAALWYIDGEEKWFSTLQDRHNQELASHQVEGMRWLVMKLRKHYGIVETLSPKIT